MSRYGILENVKEMDCHTCEFNRWSETGGKCCRHMEWVLRDVPLRSCWCPEGVLALADEEPEC